MNENPKIDKDRYCIQYELPITSIIVNGVELKPNEEYRTIHGGFEIIKNDTPA